MTFEFSPEDPGPVRDQVFILGYTLTPELKKIKQNQKLILTTLQALSAFSPWTFLLFDSVIQYFNSPGLENWLQMQLDETVLCRITKKKLLLRLMHHDNFKIVLHERYGPYAHFGYWTLIDDTEPTKVQ